MIFKKLKNIISRKKTTANEIQNLLNYPSRTHSFHPRNFDLAHPDKSVINYQSIVVDMIMDLLDTAYKNVDNDPVVTKASLKGMSDLLIEYNDVVKEHILNRNKHQIRERIKVNIATVSEEDYLQACSNRQAIYREILESIKLITQEPIAKKIPKKKRKLLTNQILINIKNLMFEDTYVHALHYQNAN